MTSLPSASIGGRGTPLGFAVSPLIGIGFRLRLDILKIQYYIAFSQAHIKTWEE
jgi:hypothetical protein